MTPGKLILIGFLVLPFAELAVFGLVSANIGFFNAFFLLMAASTAGIGVLAWLGKRLLARFAASARQGDLVTIEAGGGGFLVVLGAVLLALPGFITGIIGVALLIPPLRNLLAARIVVSGGRKQDGAIDLEDSEWKRLPDRRIDEKPGNPRIP